MEMINKSFKYLVGISLFLIISFIIKFSLENKESTNNFKKFYESEKKYDVLFIGSSHMMMDILPVELSKEYEIWSYNISVGGSTIATNYWMIINSLDYANPKLLVVDCGELSNDFKVPNAKYIHNYLDALPLSINKIKMLNDLENEIYTRETDVFNIFEYIWSPYIYHNRWKNLTKEDFKISNYYNGRGGTNDITSLNKNIEQVNTYLELNEYDKNFEIDETTGTLYLRKIIEECKKRDIELLLTYMPGNKHSLIYQKENNKAKEIAEEYNVNYIDVLNLDIYNESIDYLSDGDHLNLSGARKVTDYIGKYIRSNYDIPYVKYDEFDTEYQQYLDSQEYCLNEYKTLEQDLLVLLDKKYHLMIKFDNKEIFEEKFYRDIFLDIGVNSDMVEDNNILIIENGGLKTYFCKMEDDIVCQNNDTIVDKFLNNTNYNDFKNSYGNITIMSLYSEDDKFVYLSSYYKDYDEAGILYVE